MINTHSKGLRNQRRARAYLLCHGFRFVWFIHHTRFSKDIIIDECPFDGFAIDYDNQVHFIQVKTNCYLNLDKFKQLKINWKVMIWWDKNGWKIYG